MMEVISYVATQKRNLILFRFIKKAGVNFRCIGFCTSFSYLEGQNEKKIKNI